MTVTILYWSGAASAETASEQLASSTGPGARLAVASYTRPFRGGGGGGRLIGDEKFA